MTDLDVRNAVLAALAGAPGLDASAIGVTVHAGVATLTGRTGAFAERDVVAQVAARAEGVRGVAVEIDVCGADETFVCDEAIAARIAGFLANNPCARGVNAKPSVCHGVVTLSGALDHDEQRAVLVGFVRGLEGVAQVQDHLFLRGGAVR